MLPDLRALVVFTVQDLLTDPPFSRLDVVSCRNVMIYLGSEAQVSVLALLHFALRPGGILLLGSAETVGKAEERFEPIAKAERLYRRDRPQPHGRVRFSEGRWAMARERPGASNRRPHHPARACWRNSANPPCWRRMRRQRCC